MQTRLSAEDVQKFREQGFLVMEDVLDTEDLAPVWAEYEGLLDQVASTLYREDALSSAFAGRSFGERYAKCVSENSRVFEFLDITFAVRQEISADSVMHAGAAVFALLTNTKVLDLVESILGPEIYSNPVQHLRLKPPAGHLSESLREGYVGRTAWHQDVAGLLDEALGTDLLTVWIAMTDATIENGCLEVIAGSHRANGGKLTAHCPESERTPANYIPEAALADGRRVRLPVRQGGIVLFDKLTQHASLPNRSNDIRWAFDLRYQPVGQPTGRPAFPGFVARSARNQQSVLTDAGDWAARWQHSLAAIQSGEYIGPIYETARWDKYGDSAICA